MIPPPFLLLVVLALLFAVAALVKPTWPLTPVAVLLLCVALLLGRG